MSNQTAERPRMLLPRMSTPRPENWYYHVSAAWRAGPMGGMWSGGFQLPGPILDESHVEGLAETIAKTLKFRDPESGAQLVTPPGPIEVHVISFQLLRAE